MALSSAVPVSKGLATVAPTDCPHLTFSSGAELSHCEQGGNQSLFTNQLSSAPRQRGHCWARSRAGGRLPGGGLLCFPRATRGLCSPHCGVGATRGSGAQPRSWLRGNPWQCDFNLKSQISMPGTQAARALESGAERAPPWTGSTAPGRPRQQTRCHPDALAVHAASLSTQRTHNGSAALEREAEAPRQPAWGSTPGGCPSLLLASCLRLWGTRAFSPCRL